MVLPGETNPAHEIAPALPQCRCRTADLDPDCAFAFHRGTCAPVSISVLHCSRSAAVIGGFAFHKTTRFSARSHWYSSALRPSVWLSINYELNRFTTLEVSSATMEPHVYALSMDLTTELQRIYDSEINIRISWLWDGGIDVWMTTKTDTSRRKRSLPLRRYFRGFRKA